MRESCLQRARRANSLFSSREVEWCEPIDDDASLASASARADIDAPPPSSPALTEALAALAAAISAPTSHTSPAATPATSSSSSPLRLFPFFCLPPALMPLRRRHLTVLLRLSTLGAEPSCDVRDAASKLNGTLHAAQRQPSNARKRRTRSGSATPESRSSQEARSL